MPLLKETQEVLQEILKSFSSSELRIAYAGQPRQIYTSSRVLQEDIEKILPLSFGLIIIVLFAIFRTPRVIVVAFINVPLVYYSVDLWAADQQLHPQRNVGLEPEMRYALWVCFAAFFLLLALLLKRRIELAKIEETVEKMRQRVAAGIDY